MGDLVPETAVLSQEEATFSQLIVLMRLFISHIIRLRKEF